MGDHYTVEQLGGLDALQEAFADAPEIVLHPVPQGVIVQAGPHPQLGDVARRDFVPTLRAVAKALRPVHAERLSYGDPSFWDEWVNLLDRDFDEL